MSLGRAWIDLGSSLLFPFDKTTRVEESRIRDMVLFAELVRAMCMMGGTFFLLQAESLTLGEMLVSMECVYVSALCWDTSRLQDVTSLTKEVVSET